MISSPGVSPALSAQAPGCLLKCNPTNSTPPHSCSDDEMEEEMSIQGFRIERRTTVSHPLGADDSWENVMEKICCQYATRSEQQLCVPEQLHVSYHFRCWRKRLSSSQELILVLQTSTKIVRLPFVELRKHGFPAINLILAPSRVSRPAPIIATLLIFFRV